MIKISEKKQSEIDAVYEALKDRITWTGKLTADEAYKYCQENFYLSDMPYYRFRKAFGLMMFTLIEQGKVKRHASGVYEVIKVGKLKLSLNDDAFFKENFQLGKTQFIGPL